MTYETIDGHREKAYARYLAAVASGDHEAKERALKDFVKLGQAKVIMLIGDLPPIVQFERGVDEELL